MNFPSHHSLHPVWQQEDDAIVADPLGLSRADELVDDTLGCVVEVSELGLPEDQGIRIGHGEAELKTCGHNQSLHGAVKRFVAA